MIKFVAFSRVASGYDLLSLFSLSSENELTRRFKSLEVDYSAEKDGKRLSKRSAMHQPQLPLILEKPIKPIKAAFMQRLPT
jgi:hypothetical protein